MNENLINQFRDSLYQMRDQFNEGNNSAGKAEDGIMTGNNTEYGLQAQATTEFSDPYQVSKFLRLLSENLSFSPGS